MLYTEVVTTTAASEMTARPIVTAMDVVPAAGCWKTQAQQEQQPSLSPMTFEEEEEVSGGWAGVL